MLKGDQKPVETQEGDEKISGEPWHRTREALDTDPLPVIESDPAERMLMEWQPGHPGKDVWA